MKAHPNFKKNKMTLFRQSRTKFFWFFFLVWFFFFYRYHGQEPSKVFLVTEEFDNYNRAHNISAIIVEDRSHIHVVSLPKTLYTEQNKFSNL
jgi:hypothetical protein